jgi:hypothetical protein
MALCGKDEKATNHLRRLGYNTVRHPREGLGPLALVGKQNRKTAWLGQLERILADPSPPPPVEKDLQAGSVNGEESSKLDFSVGASVLGGLIGAMGGTLGVDAGYTNAKKISFVFQGVLSDRVEPMAVSNYLEGAPLRNESPLLREYVLGNGELFLVTETIKSNRFTVRFEREEGAEAKVDVPVIEKALGATVSVSVSAANSSTITFEGDKLLCFGFICFRLGVSGEPLRLTIAEDVVALATGGEPPAKSAAILEDEGLLELVEERD